MIAMSPSELPELHALPVDQVAALVGVDPSVGLAPEDAARRAGRPHLRNEAIGAATSAGAAPEPSAPVLRNEAESPRMPSRAAMDAAPPGTPLLSSLPPGTPLGPAFFERDPQVVACDLLGKALCHRVRGRWLWVCIVEAEAYYLAEKASHASLGYTEKRRALFMPPGTIYMYYARGGDSFNVSCAGAGNAVLVKAGRGAGGGRGGSLGLDHAAPVGRGPRGRRRRRAGRAG